MTPTFSIIIPVYNVAPYLRECLNSVLAQTRTDWECICVDDGSTDDSGKILNEYTTNDARFIVVHKKNEGVSVARNIAIGKSRGEWLTFVDSDDWIERTYLEDLFISATTSGFDISFVNVKKVFDNGRTECIGPTVSSAFPPEDLYIRYNSLCVWSVGKLIRRCEFRDVRYPTGIAYSEDRYILHRLLYPHQRIAAVGKPLYNYRIRSGSAIMSEWDASRLQVGKALMAQIDYFQKHAFKRAETFTAGLYLKWMTLIVLTLQERGVSAKSVLEDERKRIQCVSRDYFTHIHNLVHREKIPELLPLSSLYEQVMLLRKRRIGRIAHLINLIRFDGVGTGVKYVLAHMRRR